MLLRKFRQLPRSFDDQVLSEKVIPSAQKDRGSPQRRHEQMILAKQIYLSRFLFAASSVAMPADCEIHVTEMYDSSIAINSYASDSAFSEFSWNTSKAIWSFFI